MKRKVISSLVLFCWLLSTAPANGERLPVRIFTSADGLGSSFIDFLMRDSRGFLWFCTRDGLSRFDGANFITYQIDDKSAPPGVLSMKKRAAEMRSRLEIDSHPGLGTTITLQLPLQAATRNAPAATI